MHHIHTEYIYIHNNHIYNTWVQSVSLFYLDAGTLCLFLFVHSFLAVAPVYAAETIVQAKVSEGL